MGSLRRIYTHSLKVQILRLRATCVGQASLGMTTTQSVARDRTGYGFLSQWLAPKRVSIGWGETPGVDCPYASIYVSRRDSASRVAHPAGS